MQLFFTFNRNIAIPMGILLYSDYYLANADVKNHCININEFFKILIKYAV